MARIRTVKPEFWTSEQIVSCSMPTRLLFIGMWNFCDDNGVHPASASRLKMEVFPGDNIEVENMIKELITKGLLAEYQVDGKNFWIVTGWKKHQKIDRPVPRYPLPEDSTDKQRGNSEPSHNGSRGNSESSPPEGKGREGKGREKEGKGSTPSASPSELLADYTPGLKRFIKSYPKQTHTGAISRAWDNIFWYGVGREKDNQDLVEEILAGVERYKKSQAWKEAEGKYIPGPVTFLDDTMWQDVVPENSSEGGKGYFDKRIDELEKKANGN